ncbi:MAG: hypothetical protein R3343_03325 [Nitriliruptorales bacterium]|nr:hypothetical protein [Nitriliruptorales bacterium]
MTDPHPFPDGLEVDALVDRGLQLVPRIWERDHTVWQDDPDEVANRLGWLDCPVTFDERTGELSAFADTVVEEGIEHVVLVGMGGSSLYPDVLARTHGASAGHPELHVLDSTHPAAVERIEDTLPWERTLLVVSSKSGTTIETRSHLDYFWDVLTQEHAGEAGRFVAAVTDPGSALVELGEQRGFRAVFENPPDIGGRFSALSYFGLVPAALLGVDLDAHLRPGREMRERCRATGRDNPGVVLGACMAAAVRAGRDKLTLLLPDEIAPFADWIEQLVAESTGKSGTGLLPVVGEPMGSPDVYGDDRLFVVYGDPDGVDALVEVGHPVVRLPVAGIGDLGAEVFRWEFATAVCGALLGLNPFDQPNVAAAKAATSRVLDDGLPELRTEDPEALVSAVEPDDYVAILAYVDPGADLVDDLRRVAIRLRDRLHVPVTVGIGPRYLHSTGQLHKGGPDTGVFLVVVDDPESDEAIPGRGYSFGELLRAQAAGDIEALDDAGLPVAVVAPDDLLDLAP